MCGFCDHWAADKGIQVLDAYGAVLAQHDADAATIQRLTEDIEQWKRDYAKLAAKHVMIVGQEFERAELAEATIQTLEAEIDKNCADGQALVDERAELLATIQTLREERDIVREQFETLRCDMA
jgi:ABC-type phosphate transport system auxiliary subunit